MSTHLQILTSCTASVGSGGPSCRTMCLTRKEALTMKLPVGQRLSRQPSVRPFLFHVSARANHGFPPSLGPPSDKQLHAAL